SSWSEASNTARVDSLRTRSITDRQASRLSDLGMGRRLRTSMRNRWRGSWIPTKAEANGEFNSASIAGNHLAPSRDQQPTSCWEATRPALSRLAARRHAPRDLRTAFTKTLGSSHGRSIALPRRYCGLQSRYTESL